MCLNYFLQSSTRTLSFFIKNFLLRVRCLRLRSWSLPGVGVLRPVAARTHFLDGPPGASAAQGAVGIVGAMHVFALVLSNRNVDHLEAVLLHLVVVALGAQVRASARALGELGAAGGVLGTGDLDRPLLHLLGSVVLLPVRVLVHVLVQRRRRVGVVRFRGDRGVEGDVGHGCASL